MTALQLFKVIGDAIQVIIGIGIICYGVKIRCRRWDKTALDKRAGEILFVLGAIIILLMRRPI